MSQVTGISVYKLFQHTAARRRLAVLKFFLATRRGVSTHSRPKAAGRLSRYLVCSARVFQHTAARRRLGDLKERCSTSHSFNTQPPEGGWVPAGRLLATHSCFNTQPPEGGWAPFHRTRPRPSRFNTQPPEGGWPIPRLRRQERRVSTHSRPKAAGSLVLHVLLVQAVSTHSRPKAAGIGYGLRLIHVHGFNTQPPEGGWSSHSSSSVISRLFQHTAARRRLACLMQRANCVPLSFNTQPPEGGWHISRRFQVFRRVSTHSRPKAAGRINTALYIPPIGFNTQPPEGGWA